MTTKEKIKLLRSSFLFADLTEKELEEISQITQEESFPQDAVFIEEGRIGDKVYFIISGLTRVYKLNEEGKEVTIAFRHTGDVMGEMAILDDQPRSANVITIQSTKLLVLTKKNFLDLLLKYPTLAINLLKVFSKRLRDNSLVIETSHTKDLPERTYQILQTLVPHFGNGDITLSHEELASLVGATRPRITEALNSLQERGKISLGSKKIHVYSQAQTP